MDGSVSRISMCLLVALAVAASTELVLESNAALSRATAQRVETSRRQGERYAKYWVYFEDKHTPDERQEEALLNQREVLLSRLHSKAISRRKLAMGLDEEAENHLVLSLKDLPVSREHIGRLLALSEEITPAKSSRWRNAVSVVLPVAHQESILRQVQGIPIVRKVEPVLRGKCERNAPSDANEAIRERARAEEVQRRSSSVGNYDYGGSEAQLAQIGVPELHDFGLDGTGVTVLICDSGFDLKHRCFASMDIAGQHDFVNDDDDVENTNKESGYTRDPEEHGTATLSTIGGMDEGFLFGPAFRATFLIAKTEDIVGECSIEEDNLAVALEWGEELGAEIVTTSLGYQDWHTFADKDGSSELDQTIDMMAADYGILVVAAAGNEHKANAGVAVPGDAKTALTVGAVTDKGVVTEFSSRGPTVDGRVKPEVCALGWHDYVASVDHIDPPYESMSGTSFATPLVAGVAALLKQQHPSWSPMDLREALITTASGADDVQMDSGWGVVNALAALGYEAPDPTPTDHGVCNEFSDCNCDKGWYGAYCRYQRVPCPDSCLGGYCDDDDHCTCPTRWLGKNCLGPCEAVQDGCASCLRVEEAECGWCIGSQMCMLLSEGACSTSLTTTHCDTVIVVNDENTGDDSVMAVIILCFSVLLIAFVTLYFFCIIRPSSDDVK